MTSAANLITQKTSSNSFDERLERGELIRFDGCPFELPDKAGRKFLFQQEQSRFHKNITYSPFSGKLTGFVPQTPDQTGELRVALQSFGKSATDWLATLLPQYAPHWQRDRVTLRPEEEATRSLRLNARNDLIHVDAFPTRPSFGARILRVYVNINPLDPRVWATSETFPILYERFGRFVNTVRFGDIRQKCVDVFRPKNTSGYDRFMVRFHKFLKSSDRFQERCTKRYWHFPPDSVWLAFTDSLSHAVRRGRFALEHSYFVPRHCLVLPDLAPAAIFEGGFESARAA